MPADGRQRVNICVQDPIYGVVRLGYMTLDIEAYHGTAQGHGDAHVGADADQANGAHDRQAGPHPADPYLKQLIEEGRRTAPALAGSGDDHGLVPNPLFQTYAEAFQTVQDVMDDPNNAAVTKAILNLYDTPATGVNDITAANSSSRLIQPASLLLRLPQTQDDGGDRDQDTSSGSGQLPPDDPRSGPPGGSAGSRVQRALTGAAIGALIDPLGGELAGAGEFVGAGVGTLGGASVELGTTLIGSMLGWLLSGATHPIISPNTLMEGDPAAGQNTPPERSAKEVLDDYKAAKGRLYNDRVRRLNNATAILGMNRKLNDLLVSGGSPQEISNLQQQLRSAIKDVPSLENNVLSSETVLARREAEVMSNTSLSQMEKAAFQTDQVSAARGLPKPVASDADLTYIIEKVLYKDGSSTGTGSTADAVREELITGKPVKNRFHSVKAQESITRLNRWLSRSPTASQADRATAQALIDDMQNALDGK